MQSNQKHMYEMFKKSKTLVEIELNKVKQSNKTSYTKIIMNNYHSKPWTQSLTTSAPKHNLFEK